MHIKCRHCGAIAEKAGQCHYRLEDLGSVPKAIVAAAITSLILFLTWLGLAIVFDAEYAWVSIVFGLIISGTVLIFSNGLGPKYQLIATTFTIFTIFFSDLIVTWFLWEGVELELNSSFVEQLKILTVHQFSWDLYSWMFTFLGVSSGFYIWRYN